MVTKYLWWDKALKTSSWKERWPHLVVNDKKNAWYRTELALEVGLGEIKKGPKIHILIQSVNTHMILSSAWGWYIIHAEITKGKLPSPGYHGHIGLVRCIFIVHLLFYEITTECRKVCIKSGADLSKAEMGKNKVKKRNLSVKRRK